MDIATTEEIKKSFRVAYQFMETHLGVASELGQIQALVGDLRDTLAANKDDPLACRLVSGVYDYICAESRRLCE